MRRPALLRPLAAGSGWSRPYTGVLAHSVFYNGDPTASPAVPPAVPPAPVPAAAPPAPTPNNMPGAGGNPAPPAGGEPAMVQITQERLNKLMAGEKDEGRRSALRAIATEAGLDPDSIDPTQVGSLLKAAQDASRQKMTELERREADAAAAADKAARETAAAADLSRTASLQITLVRLGADIDSLGDVTALLRNDLATAGYTTPTDEQIRETAEKLKGRRPGDFGQPAGQAPATAPATLPAAPGGAPAGGPPPRVPATKDDVAARARARAEAMGLTVKATT